MKSTGRRTKPRPIPEILEGDELARILGALDSTSATGARNLVMLRLLAGLGLRSAEIIALRRCDVQWETGRVKVYGKGKRQRFVWLNRTDLAMLKGWAERGLALHKADDLLFTTDTGRPIMTRYLRALVTELAARAGIEKRVSPHSFRHTFATNLLRHTKNLELVRRALGHTNIQTTTIYTQLCDEDLQEAFQTMDEGVQL